MRNIMLKRTIKLFLFVLVSLGFFAVVKVQANAGELKMHTIYVGHGDCILLESKGHYMLVDSGESSAKNTILNYLEKHVVGDTIDYVVATHADKDHIGSFPAIFKKYEIKNIVYSEPMKPYYNPDTGKESHYGKFMDAINEEEGLVHSNPYEGQTWTFGDASVKVIYDGRQGTTYNESSIVTKVTCDNKSILMTGDLPTTMEEKLMAKKYNMKADILKVGHHGAAASTCADFLDYVKPAYAVIPNGYTEEGTYFPRDSVLQRLALRFIKTYLATEGDIVMNIKNGVISTTHKENKKFQCISRGQIVVIGDKFYASNTIGKKVTPKVHVYANGELIPASQYKVTYKDATHTGVATIKVTGTKEKYVGTLNTTFNLLPRLSKLLKWSRSKNKKKFKLQWSAQNYASGYTIWYSSDKNMVKDSHKITIKGGKNNTKTLKGLKKKKKKYYVKIQAFTNGIGKGKWTTKKCIK